MKKLLALSIGVVGLSLAGAASAGLKQDNQVIVNTASSVAFGSMGSARNSGDATQFIGCTVEGSTSGTLQFMICSARNSAGTAATCNTTDVHLIAAAQSMTPDSFLEFTWNSSSQCTFLEVSSGSWAPPKQP